jgi:antitoxin (DNA-binding transcriptional repressor) of toxin-antitoxin stability system
MKWKLTDLVMRDSIAGMNLKKTGLRKIAKGSDPAVLEEVAAAPGIGEVFGARAAKARLDAWLELVSGGTEATSTSAGKPKARLASAVAPRPGKVFLGMGDDLKSMPMQTQGRSPGLRSSALCSPKNGPG